MRCFQAEKRGSCLPSGTLAMYRQHTPGGNTTAWPKTLYLENAVVVDVGDRGHSRRGHVDELRLDLRPVHLEVCKRKQQRTAVACNKKTGWGVDVRCDDFREHFRTGRQHGVACLSVTSGFPKGCSCQTQQILGGEQKVPYTQSKSSWVGNLWLDEETVPNFTQGGIKHKKKEKRDETPRRTSHEGRSLCK